jgi:two-component system, OmpR family, phosphate regulon response regulator PhoB
MVETQRTVLIVEDEIDIADMLVVRFTVQGFLTLLARSRDSALRLLLTHGEPDCILMDWFMPGMSAPDFIEKARQVHPEVQFVAISAVESIRDIAGHYNICEFVQKPFDPEVVVQATERCVAQRRKQN